MRRVITILTLALLGTIVAQGQIKIGGNVYGGGNQAVVKGSTKVTVKSGDIGAILDKDATRPLEDPKGKVFGGARMANVGGNTFVHIDGKSEPVGETPNYILINQVFGGNDIAGTIGTAAAVGEDIPAELEEVGTAAKKNNVDATFNSYVRVSTKTAYTAEDIAAATEGDPAYGQAAGYEDHYTQDEINSASANPDDPAYGKTTSDIKPPANARKVYIGQLFAGGNGDYDYEQTPGPGEGKVTHYIYDKKDKNHQNPVAQVVTDEGEVGFQLPELDKTYLEIKGGSIVYGYGGGNNTTVREQNIIHYDNPSAVVNHIWTNNAGAEVAEDTEGAIDLLTTERFKEMGINTTFSQPSSGEFQVGRFFGGNNQAEMHIRPTWNLLSGKIRNLYSGGNRGAMTSPEGLLLEIKEYSTLIVDNLYGGCRMADVMPTVNGVYVPCTNLPGYKFPNELSARTLVRGGHINNVYGGNDVTGTVYGGNGVGIYATVYGDVYGGGNGNYPYTDSEDMVDDDTYGDFHYSSGDVSSAEALNAFRPNAEQVSLRLRGTAEKNTVIQGSVFVGGNCASLDVKKKNPLIELKMGSYVIAENVFLGNNGAGMINSDYLEKYADDRFSSLTLTDPSVFSDYMEGVAMTQKPRIVFDNTVNGDPETYVENSSFVGSFFCGGNIGSMAIPGKQSFTIDHNLVIYDKFVGGCNNANVPEGDYNAAYKGGVIGGKDERDSYTEDGKIKDRLEINLENMTLVPLRWNNSEVKDFLLWNKNKWAYVAVEKGETLIKDGIYYTFEEGDYHEFTATGEEDTESIEYFEQGFVPVPTGPGFEDPNNRLLGANAYGGCYESGHVNGNVVININDDVVKKDEVFGDGTNFIGRPKSNIDFEGQRDDLMALSMSVFGAGYGKDTEIWGNTTVNLNNGYAFQIYGGGEKGVVGKPRDVLDEHGEVIRQEYYFDPAFSSTVNLNGATAVYSNDDTPEDLAEAEYLYGGGNEGDVCGNTYVNLGNGRIYDAFGGASDADILGHTEVIIGRQPNGSGGYKSGFPWVQDIVYGGNDFGGTIEGAYEDGFDYKPRIRDYEVNKTQMYDYAEGKHDFLLKTSSYVEYQQGRVDSIFGGSYGYYDYTDKAYYGVGCEMPRQESAFVNLRPVSNDRNSLNFVFGGGTGYPGARDGDKTQDRSYVLVDLPHENGEGLKNLEVFGAGSYNGLGMREDAATTFAPGYDFDKASAIIDLLHGEIGNAYGGSYREGNTLRTMVNVPEESTIKLKNIFGGAYGVNILPPCDVIHTTVNYRNTSENAVVTGAIYGGNNSQRRSIFTNVFISSPVWSDKSKGYLATVYGAGKGYNSWSEHTRVELLNGAQVYEVYGGGEMGHVLNAESVQKYMQLYTDNLSPEISEQDPFWSDTKGGAKWSTIDGKRIPNTDDLKERWANDWIDAWSLGDYYSPIVEGRPEKNFKNYFDTFVGLRNSPLVRKAEIDERDYSAYSPEEKSKRQYIYNTNVIIDEGAEVVNYAYGGGLGDSGTPLSGDVWGSTYIALLGGKVRKDIYAAGTTGSVSDAFPGCGPYNASTNPYGFTASATAYIKGGSCRNVYGGGWVGNVGVHSGKISDSAATDIPGETYVVIGDLNGSSFTDGIPTIQRNAYGGGEGGAVYGTAHVKLNHGYIGYEYKGGEYVEKTADDTKDLPNTLLVDAGNVFGGGYIDNSTVDKTDVMLNGGVVRNSVFGGGEVAAIGRGEMKAGGSGYVLKDIYRPGKTFVEMYKGHVHRNVYGGGRGYDNLGRIGSLNCAGYVFGQTEVRIHGGEIGTVVGLAKGDGNVFGGGDIGHVYSAYEKADGSFGRGMKEGERYDGKEHSEGYYYQYEDDAYVTGYPLTEDCKVLIEPMCQAKLPVSIDGTAYAPGDFVPIEKLNKLRDKNTDAYTWGFLDDSGIIIHNAVFAGGNNPPGASATSANTPSVFGNATASVHDVFHRDLITLGTGHTGGLYGDGNLTLVDGYRELNITDYGTDYYSIAKEITIDQYHNLPDREAAYYELRYTCQQDCKDKEGTQYHQATGASKASTLTADEMQTLFLKKEGDSYVSVKDGETDIMIENVVTHEWEPNPTYWKESGVLPVYAGRLMNSIQRADFCGVFGSRMVMQGAQDRVPEEADYTNYTINRVREVSLNKHESVAGDDVTHGNYFGIYNIVNYLGALTSDKDFGDDNTRVDPRTTDNADAATYQIPANGQAYGDASFYDWKKEFHLERKRNNGNSHNKVALASGVYLEITTEKSTGTGLYEKDWGPITGVVELDLINVSPGIGGGFVYAQNIHGKRKLSGKTNTTLTELNTGAITKKKFLYDDNGSASEDYTYDNVDHEYKTQWQSSGNFVHSTQTIIDDCYNISNKYLTGYKGEKGVPAHYWYIKGTTYVYDQYISAYTGQPNAYSEAADIPLTIAAASHGKMKLLDVKPNRYAYYSAPGVKLESGKKMVINDKTYYANDPISYWDWYLLPAAEKELFVEKTYTNCVPVCIDGGDLHEPGTLVMTQKEYDNYGTHTYTNAEGDNILDGDKEVAGKDYIFRVSNNASHDTGYLLTYEVNNPSQWDTWYTPKETSYTGKISTTEYAGLTPSVQDNYEDGPTYRLNVATGGEVLGQQSYAVGDLISKNVEVTYQAIPHKPEASTQATFQPAYIVTKKITVTDGGVEHNYYPGTTVSEAFAAAHDIKVDANTAYICTKTVKLSADDLIFRDSKMSKSEWQALYDSYKNGDAAQKKIAAELLANIVPAYYCTKPGLYGGSYYQAGNNYRGLEAWSSMSKSDREQFVFNYDALDLLVDSSYSKKGGQSEGKKYQYDSVAGNIGGANANKAHYSLETSVDYTAEYNSDTDLNLGTKEVTVKRGESVIPTSVIEKGDELSREVFEDDLANEQRHYAPIAVKSGIDTYYVVNYPFQVGATPYAVGEVISKETYNSLPDQEYVTTLTFAETPTSDQTIYYCRENYTSGSDITTYSESVIDGAGTGEDGSKGTLISYNQYKDLPNEQKNFTIHGISPTETSTLYVSRESNIYDLSKEKIITVVYQYDYEETDGSNVTPVSERHVLNIHLQFKSGVPVVEDITPPDLILPGWLNAMREPEVTPGAYEVTGGGWELFETKADAERHTNGMEYAPTTNPLYWYQNGYYVAYYAKTYLGRTYSNAVPVSVANYHDMKEVMGDKEHHYYVDIPEAHRHRDPKIYINDYSASGENGLDIFKSLFDLSLLHTDGPDDAYKVTTDKDGIITTGDFKGHHTIDNHVKGGKDLVFFLRTDIDHPESWTPIGAGEDPCFEGTLHGDGHTVSGLNNSLFHKLCGDVYNLGVTGSFSTAGVVDTGKGYVESCWVNTTGTPDEGVRAVFGEPTASSGYKQVVNCYYQTGKSYSTTDTGSHGLATAKSDMAFYNGEVAYDLNNFYLYKRYNDGVNTASGVDYKYFTLDAGGNIPTPKTPQTGYYAQNVDLCSSGYNGIKYVEERFRDGDFRYAAGEIPESEDERFYTWKEKDPDDSSKEIEKSSFFPIWPDDYIFFGQKLTYGWGAEAHQEVPTAVARDGGRLSPNDDANRVYRAPAYFRSADMGVAHFNPQAYLAQNSYDGTKEAYPGMTAIDFNGHQEGHATSAYTLGLNDGWFYSPLLDDDGLTSIRNCDETQNLLVYAPAASGDGYVNAQTHGVLTAYFVDPVYDTHYSYSGGYRLVSENVDNINGHLVQSDLTATNDHLLVDKQDFNAPLAYTFDASHLMWYQRKPGLKEYVDLKNGWQGISLPFTAELVTTDTKGEITHFYSGSETSKNGTGSKIGHEYWLREFRNIKKDGTSDVAMADFLYPAAAGASKTVGNTFLWDYYYKNTDRKDANDDIYQKYYSSSRNYTAYPLLTAGTPYILGLPGSTYYEFDLSGKFEAQHTALPAPAKLPKQVITFASNKGAAIGVSDDEMAGKKITYGGREYTFKPSYMNETLKTAINYVMNSEGNAYVKLNNSGTGKYITTGRTYATPEAFATARPLYTDADGTTEAESWANPITTYYTRVREITKDDNNHVTSSQSAFRPYFISALITSSGSTKMGSPNEIIFTGDYDDLIDEPISMNDGTLEIYTREHNIVTTSHLQNPVTITVVSVAGIMYANYTLQPGETVETPVRPGVYIVNRKKLLVKPGHRRFN